MFLTRVLRSAMRAPSWVSSSGSRFPPPVGLEPDPNCRNTLLDIYRETLELVKAIPPTAVYRVNVEKTTKHRMLLVEGTEDIMELEKKIGVGMIEEVIVQAQNELDLVPFMTEHKPWEVPPGTPKAPVKIELID
mmetsp:Transcript_12043/g.20572  ORF Transcript_12043/g.20572 Transcript_12043/m.20572 type:complete len:134 (+) Transcript_12043:100-501(+)